MFTNLPEATDKIHTWIFELACVLDLPVIVSLVFFFLAHLFLSLGCALLLLLLLLLRAQFGT